MNILKSIQSIVMIFLFSIFVSGSAFSQKHTIDMHEFDANIWNTSKIWHGKMGVKDFAILLKGHCMQESALREGASREENGYLTGKYAAQIKRDARFMQKYAQQVYGTYQSQFTWAVDLSRSYGLVQIMGDKAFEEGFRCYSMLDPDEGLINVDTGLYYGAKFIHANLERYGYDEDKAISAYNAGSYTTRNTSYVANVKKYMTQFEHDFDKFDN